MACSSTPSSVLGPILGPWIPQREEREERGTAQGRCHFRGFEGLSREGFSAQARTQGSRRCTHFVLHIAHASWAGVRLLGGSVRRRWLSVGCEFGWIIIHHLPD